MMENNVLKYRAPEEIELSECKAIWDQIATDRQEWIIKHESFCLKLAGVRNRFRSNIEFGKACETIGLGQKVLSHETRAAAIAMGLEPVALRKCLEVTERNSLRTIYKLEFSRFINVDKTLALRDKHGIKAALLKNTTQTNVEIARNLGVAESSVRRAKKVMTTPKPPKSGLGPTPQEHNLTVKQAVAAGRYETYVLVWLETYRSWPKKAQRQAREIFFANLHGAFSNDRPVHEPSINAATSTVDSSEQNGNGQMASDLRHVHPLQRTSLH